LLFRQKGQLVKLQNQLSQESQTDRIVAVKEGNPSPDSRTNKTKEASASSRSDIELNKKLMKLN